MTVTYQSDKASGPTAGPKPLDRGFQTFGRCYGDLWLMYADGSNPTRLDVTRYGIACSRMPAWRAP